MITELGVKELPDTQNSHLCKTVCLKNIIKLF